jgi:hypothetical protein
MSKFLDEDDFLHALLGKLLSMNMQCGKQARNLDIDFKHKLKVRAIIILGVLEVDPADCDPHRSSDPTLWCRWHSCGW